MFPSGYPVLLSSGRSALVLSLDNSGCNRSDLVGIFSYASHCVLDAVARVATPLAGSSQRSAKLRIVYHQWGYVQEYGLPDNTIEDSVDTLCIPGADLFSGGGRFEIWSLPKILGTTSGAVLWCRDKKTALEISNLRDKKGGGVLQWLFRLLSARSTTFYDYWQGREGNLGAVSRAQTGELLSAIRHWDLLVYDRTKKLEAIWTLAPDWLTYNPNRLPIVVPIDVVIPIERVKKLGLTAGYRMFERVYADGSTELVKLLPIPIHQGVSLKWLNTVSEEIRKWQ